MSIKTLTTTFILALSMLLGGCVSYQTITHNPYKPDIPESQYPNMPDDVRLYLTNYPLPRIGDSLSPINQAYGAPVRITFDNNKSVIAENDKAKLKEVANILREQSLTKIELFAYASEIGKPDHNLELAQQRGNAVMLAILNFASPYDPSLEKRISVIAKGSSSAVSLAEHSGNTKKDQLNLNRSVLIKITRI